ncbi:FadR/GntR family transcriptional regulator [Pseudonocardia sichuanensis]
MSQPATAPAAVTPPTPPTGARPGPRPRHGAAAAEHGPEISGASPSGLRAPARTIPLSRQVADQLLELISSGRWPVGTRVPPEHDLVADLGVSRNTVREALRALVYLGLLESRPGDGTYVRASSELEASLARRVHRTGTAEAFEVRAVLEQHAAGFAAARRRPHDVEHLRVLLARLLELDAGGDTAAFLRADAELHRAVVACAGNDLLTELYDSLGSARVASVATRALGREHLAAEQRHRHAALVEAIAAGDVPAAQRAAIGIVAASQDAEPGDQPDDPRRGTS